MAGLVGAAIGRCPHQLGTMNVMVRFRAVVMVAVVGCLLGLSQPVGLAPAAAQPAEDAEDTATTAAASGGEEQDEAGNEAGDPAESDDGAASESSGMAVFDNHLNPRNDGMLIKPNEGVAPDDPGDRGVPIRGRCSWPCSPAWPVSPCWRCVTPAATLPAPTRVPERRQSGGSAPGPERVQRRRVGQTVPARCQLRVDACQDTFDGHFQLLAGQCARHLAHFAHLVGDVPGRQGGA